MSPAGQAGPREDPVHRVQEVVAVRAFAPGLVRGAREVGVGGADHRDVPPAQDEEGAAVRRRAEHEGLPVADAVVGHHQVDPLGGADQAGIHSGQAQGLVGPGPGGVQDAPGGHGEAPAAQPVLQVHGPAPFPCRGEARRAQVVEHQRAPSRSVPGLLEGLQHQAGVVHQGVVVDPRHEQVPGVHRGLPGRQLVRGQEPVGQVLVPAEGVGKEVIQDDAQPHPGRRVPAPGPGAQAEPQGAHQVRQGVAQPVALRGSFPHQAELPLGQVAEPSVGQLGGPGGSAEGEVLLVRQEEGDPAQRRLPGQAGASDAPADDDQVERAGPGLVQGAAAILGAPGEGVQVGERGLVHELHKNYY